MPGNRTRLERSCFDGICIAGKAKPNRVLNMNRIVVAGTIILSLAMSSSLILYSQEQDGESTFTTSFEFWGIATRFLLGSYILGDSIPSMIVVVRSKDGRFVEEAPTLIEEDPVDPSV
jgi:hypothetical protein